MNEQHRTELADFLRTRRAQLVPEAVGFSSRGRRRTPGLRREEVSQLAGMSVTWYTWLEQGRDINVSSQVLSSLARALNLDHAERRHLFSLCGQAISEVGDCLDDAPDALSRLLASIDPNPAYGINARWDIITWNRAYEALFVDIASLPRAQRNLLRLVFTSQSVRQLLSDWEGEARRLLAQFRAELAQRAPDHGELDMIAELQRSSPELREWWEQHAVAGFASRLREFRHPVVGPLVLEHHKLSYVEHDGLNVVMYTPADRDSGERLSRLVGEQSSVDQRLQEGRSALATRAS